MPPGPYFTSFSFPEHTSGIIINILMVLGSIMEQVNRKCRKQEWQLCFIYFLIMSSPIFLLRLCSWSVIMQPFKVHAFFYYLVGLQNRSIWSVGQYGVSHARMTNLLIFIFLLCPLIRIFTLIFACISVTIWNISMILCRIIQQVKSECLMQEWRLCLSSFYNHLSWSIF